MSIFLYKTLFFLAFICVETLWFHWMSTQPHSATISSGAAANAPLGRILEEQLEAMVTDPRQRERLARILSGALTRKDVEVVIARHDEDVSWSNMYQDVRIIYDKSGRTEQELPANTTRGLVVPLPNIGRESHTILWHIVANYNSLANLTVFSQGAPPTAGYGRKGAASGDRGGHLLEGSTFHDFVLTTADEGHFVFTATLFMPTLSYR